ncbi:MAG: twin-arginine translocase TatA/TatE family subunit [Candidatus Dormibacteria bacterium]
MDRLFYLIPIVLVVVLIVWGPKKLPEVGAGMGRAIREFRSALSGGPEAGAYGTPPANPGAGYDQPRPWAPVPNEQAPVTVPDDTLRS